MATRTNQLNPSTKQATKAAAKSATKSATTAVPAAATPAAPITAPRKAPVGKRPISAAPKGGKPTRPAAVKAATAAPPQPSTPLNSGADNPVSAAATTVKGKANKAVKPTKAAKSEKAAKPSKPAKVDKTEKASKVEKAVRLDKLIRDSFTMPESDFKLIAAIKQRALGFQHAVKKSEVLRAGLMALQGLSETQLRALLENLPVIKTGRPKKAG